MPWSPPLCSIGYSRHKRRDAAEGHQELEIKVSRPIAETRHLGNFTSAHLGKFAAALTGTI